jgi:hypothetical protein
MNGDTTNIGPDQLHLTHVDANANLQALLACGSADRTSAAQRLGGTIERRQQPVAGGRDLAAAEALQLRPRRLEVPGEELAPGHITQPSGHDRGTHQVRKQKRHQDPTMRASPKASEGAQSRPLDHHTRLLADGVAIVRRCDVVNLVGSELQHRAVLEQHAEPTREDDPDMAGPAPLAANHRTGVR